ncbi:GH92 family glycosyl hydrolase [Actinoplanes regularis]|uniref:Alpha-1,2-mannosidase, putative n=1 Tax=Actinoplanes regularis TaxID=52697 RepID=A0A239F662_9ACTN|nr:GH92 family glycosyl hydrolase [Actinoplanes regularis]GIE89965.1 alpha-1,2-mannosidase [Actinoplanes regularis]SNS51662.1 alpha-1,2-mannosidase, putative [Actinoplanes regularis]
MSMSRVRAGLAGLVGAVLVVTLAAAVPAAGASPPVVLVEDPASYVDPFIGTTRGGNTWPGASRPFGMIAWSPTSTSGDQTGTGGGNGYEYNVTKVRGFSLTHLNGAGCSPGAAGDVPIMPFVGEVNSSPTADTRDQRYVSTFSHADEAASPGRYTVGLDNGVRTDLAVSTRAGIADFTFPTGSAANLLFRTSNSLNGSEDARITIDPATRTVTGSVLTGGFCGRRGNGGGATNPNRRSYYRLYFSAVFDRDFAGTGTWQNATVTPGGTTATGGEGYLTGADRAGKGSGGWVGFDTSAGGDVRMRVGISYVSEAGAAANRDAEVPGTATVDSVAAATRDAWNTELGRVQVAGGTDARTQAFYTAIYHSLMQPQTISDLDGRYLGADLQIHAVRAGQGNAYGTFSGWDQYRAQIQLLALLRPDVAGDMAQSMLDFSAQNKNVWDRWLHLGASTHVMTGDPAAPTLATYYAMGVRNFDADAALTSLVRQATVQNPDALSDLGCPGQCLGQRPTLNTYLALKYAANDICHCWGGAAETLENSLADFSLAMWARRAGRNDLYRQLLPRGDYWKNTFNPAVGYQAARRADGSWQSGFTPSTDVGFAQGSSATYTWMVPQDVSGLAALMGGREAAATRLDGFFHDEAGNWAVLGGNALRYDPTNEPGIHAPWLYNGLGQPWKTQETVRQIVDTAYGTGPAGLPGNDDLGTMSAWYVFAAIGLFPQVPGRAELLLGSPVFTRIELLRSNGVRLTVTADTTDKYVQSAELNGKNLSRSWLPESFVQRGGTVAFTLGTAPNRTWATAAADLPRDH